MEKIVTREEEVVCERDHPRVYLTTKGKGYAICGYCNVKYVHISRVKSQMIKDIYTHFPEHTH